MSSPSVPPPLTGQPRRLTRSREDRVIAGVAGGLGRYLGIDPVIVRIVLVVLALAGGSGVLAYLIAWLVVPEAPADGEVAMPPASTGASTVFGLVLVALGGLLLVDVLIPGATWRFVGPGVLIALGVLLVTRRDVRS